MSAPDHVNAPVRRGLRVRTEPSQAKAGTDRAGAAALFSRVVISRMSPYAWGALGATVAFIAITCWWLTKDRGVPIYDAGDQLETALLYRNMLAAGNIFGPFTFNNIYPILGHIVGAVGALIGGVSVASPIVAENVVFVPLLALGCYQTGKLLYGPLAGMLAVIFVLGSPLLISTFHVFLLDPPLTALVALALWLVLACEDFRRPGMSALAGLAVGLGVNMKVQFALFLICLVLVLLAHGGWRNWRGLAIFTVCALAVGLPWFIVHSSELKEMFELASSGGGTPPGNIPVRWSTTNLLWYFWSVLNSQLLAPLFILVVIGGVWTTISVIRAPRAHAARLEFLLGGLGAWFVITFITIHHDIRYGMPLLGYLAVLGTGWIACVPRTARMVGIAVVVLGVAANTLALNLGIGSEVRVALASPLPTTEQAPDQIVLYTPNGFISAAPIRDGDIPGLFEELHREGVRTVAWGAEQSEQKDFSEAGLVPLARIAQLAPVVTQSPEYARSPSIATLIHEPIGAHSPPICARLSDDTGVWVVRFDGAADKLALYCPSHHPQFYDPGAVG